MSIPSPAEGVLWLGPIPLRGYAFAIILGIIVAVWVSERRWQARGGRAGDIQDIALWAVPFGLVGGRIYHVITDWQLYFGDGAHPIEALYIWRGGLGVWGAIALGAVGAIIGARTKGIKIVPLLDTIAPTCLLAMGIGRWGNWFNQELYGRPTDLPWGLEIDPSRYPDGPSQFPVGTTFHPTFLYEFLWDIALFFVIVYLQKKLRLGGGRVVALYVMAYCLGRGLIETLRIDNVQLANVLGLRWSEWMSIILFVLAAAWWAYATFTGRGKVEDEVYSDPAKAPANDTAIDTEIENDSVGDDADNGTDDEESSTKA
ncbi:prolipoprotein diacylglyceryl transferase [Nocardioides luteus]|uniref:prolipoprotein diacylglyceryl transferase n=1 Tax=Nocardioides luteus TaxID=1844 RepID=UPI001A23D105|nr:prolipoprotein diacylglyceryl transferase [Nocardioides luteus]MBG6097296.1 prolipoprotein diacylglyceryl transferase [Nocardioides luteus]